MDWTWGPADTWHKTQRFLEGLAATLPAPPKAMLVVSGHWEEPAFTASAAADPKLIFDYSGFPEHTYRLTWPAPGDPELAARVAGLLTQAGLAGSAEPEPRLRSWRLCAAEGRVSRGADSCGHAVAGGLA